ncbi:MAG: arginine--tRNA ligase [Fibrobacterota bacterium]
MGSIPLTIEEKLKNAVIELYGEDALAHVFIRETDNPSRGDYQTEFAMRYCRVVKKSPLELAENLRDKISGDSFFLKVEAVRPGFLNFFVSDRAFSSSATSLFEDWKLGAGSIYKDKKMVIDYSSPNIAKRMHIGHFRATIIGDAIYRIYRFAGADIISDNHIGDWGTQFGKLIAAYKKWLDPEAYKNDPVGELERLYQKFDIEKNEDLLNEAREELVRLQSGDPHNTALWKDFRRLSLSQFDKVYEKLGVKFDVVLGESFYNDMLQEVASELETKKIAKEDAGALIVDTKERYGVFGPIIVRKKDGGFGYPATDLATIKYRIENYSPERIIYVTDNRQQDHFRAVFAVAEEWLGKVPDLVHVWFGVMRSSEGTFSSRSGNTIMLSELINEACEKARAVVEEKNPSLSDEEKNNISEVVGIGALKYSDLNHDPKTNTVFNWEQMLSFEGNTAPYLLYTYARIKSVLRKHEAEYGSADNAEINVENDIEREIIKQINSFPRTVKNAAEMCKPNLIGDFVFSLASSFNTYYNRRDCQVVKETEPGKRESRKALYGVVATYIKTCLDMLGIQTLERM